MSSAMDGDFAMPALAGSRQQLEFSFLHSEMVFSDHPHTPQESWDLALGLEHRRLTVFADLGTRQAGSGRAGAAAAVTAMDLDLEDSRSQTELARSQRREIRKFRRDMVPGGEPAAGAGAGGGGGRANDEGMFGGGEQALKLLREQTGDSHHRPVAQQVQDAHRRTREDREQRMRLRQDPGGDRQLQAYNHRGQPRRFRDADRYVHYDLSAVEDHSELGNRQAFSQFLALQQQHRHQPDEQPAELPQQVQFVRRARRRQQQEQEREEQEDEKSLGRAGTTRSPKPPSGNQYSGSFGASLVLPDVGVGVRPAPASPSQQQQQPQQQSKPAVRSAAVVRLDHFQDEDEPVPAAAFGPAAAAGAAAAAAGVVTFKKRRRKPGAMQS